jgi:peptide/nickel transport system ATP-binding protein
MDIDNPLLTVERLSVLLPASPPLVKGISFSMGQERLALVGESGSGKSLTARALMGLLPPPLQLQAQRLTLGDDDLTRLNERQWNRLRGNKVAMVMQDPKHALNPTQPIGRQVEEPLLCIPAWAAPSGGRRCWTCWRRLACPIRRR